MIMGNHFIFQDGRSRTAFLKTTATKFSFCIVSRYLATGQSEIVLGKTHPILLKIVLWSCLEMSSDLNYNFGFVVGDIVLPGHTRKSRCLDTLKAFVLWLVSINSPTIISTKIEVGILWEYSIFVQKGEAILNKFCICCGRILLASSFYKNLDSRARLF